MIREIYKMLSYGCGVYIFTSDDPFASIGMEQEELYGEYVARQVNRMLMKQQSLEWLMEQHIVI